MRRAIALLCAGLCALHSGCTSNPDFHKPLSSAAPVRSVDFAQTVGGLLEAPLVAGNRIRTLNNGDEIFPAMLAAIRGARHSVNFETYVYYDGAIPAAFAEALAERARAGVKVKVVVDAYGASKSRRFHDFLREAGVELEVYHPITWPDLRRYNNRTHRKLLIVDGRVGFIGGVGIADEWGGNARGPEEWRDLHYRVEGPAVAQLQGAFSENWRKTRSEVLQGPDYFPPLEPRGNARAGVFYGSPRVKEFQVELMFHLVIASARESLLIESAYFLPTDELVTALCAAAQRGVAVKVIMPGEHIDQPAVRRASRKRWGELLDGGVELYEYQPTMLHSKLLIADGVFVSVGSSNFDPRSLRLNAEANMNVIDAAFAREQTGIFERDLAHSKRIRREDGEFTTGPVQVAEAPLEGQL